MPSTLTLQTGRLTAAAGRRCYRARFVAAGQARAAGNRPAGFSITPRALQEAAAAGRFDGRAVFLDHAGLRGAPSLRDLVAVTRDSAYDPASESILGSLYFYDTPAATAVTRLLDELLAEGPAAPDIGLSIVFWPLWSPGDAPGQERQVLAIRHVESVDLVFEPAAGGRILQALAAGNALPPPGSAFLPAADALRPVADALRPVDKFPLADPDGSPAGTWVELDLSQLDLSEPEPGCLANRPTLRLAPPTPQPVDPGQNGGAPMTAIPTPEANRPTPTSPAANPPAETAAAWSAALAESAAQTMIAASGLPPAARQRLAAQPYHTPDDVIAAISAERAYLARLQEDQVVQIGGQAPRSPQISGLRTGLDQVALALDALLAGSRPPTGVAPLSGVRELYHLLSGDYEMTGLFQPERVGLASVNSATMAGLVANALNKRLANEFQRYPMWWEPFVSVEDFASLQQIRWITLGGVGELPTVAEGAAYTELAWDDQTETASFVKKGGYLGLSLEAIDKDDTGRLTAVPRALAQAAWLTLGKSISAIFTGNSGVGPTMSDSQALFHSDHGNLGSGALSFSAYAAARTAMRKQTELNSGERLGALTAPRYLLVPPDLEITALQILATEQQPGQANYQENPLAEGDYHDARLNAARKRVIVVDLWTDTNDWAAVADPRFYPSIGLGFRYGRTPEVFSVASPTAGLMFSNDTLPVKVRFFYAVGPIDWRGVYKANVA